MHGDAGSPSRYGEDLAPLGCRTALPKSPMGKIKAAPRPASAAGLALGRHAHRTPGTCHGEDVFFGLLTPSGRNGSPPLRSLHESVERQDHCNPERRARYVPDRMISGKG
jgi:hypothetical protein